MNFWENTANSVTKAVDFIVDKNRRAAMMNRLKIVIKDEKESQARAYIQLGKYYYQNMRDEQNGDTEIFCEAVDKSGDRLKRAYAKLDELAVPVRGCCAPGSGCCGAEDSETKNGEDSEDADEAGNEDFDPEAGYRQDVSRQEAADDEEYYLHPFSVVPNDGEQEKEEPDAGEPDEEPAEEPKN